MDLKQIVEVATEMRENHSSMLDISDKTDNEIALIAALVKEDGIYNFFVEVQDMPLDEIYFACKFFEAQDELKKVNNKLATASRKNSRTERKTGKCR